MTIIGLTGPTGAGKSSLSETTRKMGFKVIDCDKVARTATEKGTAGLKALALAFGEDILNNDGTLNRKALARKAFETKEKTELLNKTVLPYITELVQKECDRELIILDAPTLFESGINSICKATVAVLADKSTRLNRIMERDGIDEESALLRMNAGKPDEFYRENADYIVYNNGDIEVFTNEFSEILTNILKER